MNVNLLLENSKRSDMSGYNLALINYKKRNGDCEKIDFAMMGTPFFGHELKEENLLKYTFFCNEKELSFDVVRHRWTPSWLKTYYRAKPDESYYKKDGCILIKEEKCITQTDSFVSWITIFNDSKDEQKIRLKTETFAKKTINGYIIDTEPSTGAVGKTGNLVLFASLISDKGNNDNFEFLVKANSPITVKIVFSFSKISEKNAEEKALSLLKEENPFKNNEKAFNKWFYDNVPQLKTGNIDLLKVYYYRHYLIKRNIHNPSAVIENHPIDGECVYESPSGGWYNCPIGLSTPLAIEEMRWNSKKNVVYNTISNWAELNGKKHENWIYHGYIQYTPYAIWNYCKINPNEKLIADIFQKCVDFTLRELDDNDKYGFLPTEGSWHTGAEYQPAFYQHTDLKWNWLEDSEGVAKKKAEKKRKIYRIDSLCFNILNLKACVNMAHLLQKTQEEKALREKADFLIDILKKYFWNEKKRAFTDIDYLTEKQCDEAIGYDSFEPFIENIVGNDFYEAFSNVDTIFNTEFSIPTVETDCPMYWFDNELVGPANATLQNPHEYDCCWNGPVWPYANTLFLEGLGTVAKNDEKFTLKWLNAFESYTDLHFLKGDRSLPVICEHYCPTDGRTFSQQFDYFHSKWIDLFMKYYVGITVDNGKLVDFKPFAKEEFEITNVKIGDSIYNFSNIYSNETETFLCKYEKIQ